MNVCVSFSDVILRNGAHIQLTEHREIHMDNSCMYIN